MQVEVSQDETAVLRSLVEVAVNLSSLRDRQQMLDMILQEARRLTRAEAGSLYILQQGELVFVAAQNDNLSLAKIGDGFFEYDLSVTPDSLVGFVASSGRVMNIPDAYSLPSGMPFNIDRRFDSATGYRTQSILAIPLKCPDGDIVGVLQLINRIGAHNDVVPFPGADCGGVLSLASMAGATLHNVLLQERLKKAHLDTIIRLSVAAEFRDDDTGMHVRRMSRCSALIARAMGLDESKVELIECASPMHDIGKIGIPDAILLKPARLTPEERKVVETHAAIGARILAGAEGDPHNELIPIAHDIALTHHEKWDGKGYPNKLSGNRIPLAGRIVGLADVFDALVSKRCYKDPYPLEEALEIIRSDEGKHFDPKVVGAFFETLDEVLETYKTGDPSIQIISKTQDDSAAVND